MKNLLIIGSDIHAYSVAARLAVGLRGQNVALTVLEHDDFQKNAQAKPSVAAFGLSAHAYHASLGLKESDLITHLKGAYSYGAAQQNWSCSGGIDCLFTWSPTGKIIDGVRFHKYVNKLRLSGSDVAFDSFCVAAVAASEQRFSHPKPGSVAEQLDYCYQFDAARYRQLLRAFCQDHGVNVIADQYQSLSVNEQGYIKSVSILAGGDVSVDFVFDATATSEIHSQIQPPVADRADKNGWQDYFDYLPIGWVSDEVSYTKSGTPTIATLVKSEKGCIRSVPLQGRVHHRRYFAEQQADEDQQRVGYQSLPWKKNCIAIGRAVANLGDMIIDEYTPTHLAIEQWLELYPAKDDFTELLAQEYNRVMTLQYRHIVDVQSVPFVCSQDSMKNVTDTLQHRLSLFRQTGCIAFYENDVLNSDQWINLLIGNQCWPVREDPLICHVSEADIERVLNIELAQVQSFVSSMPQHDALLNAVRQSIEKTRPSTS